MGMGQVAVVLDPSAAIGGVARIARRRICADWSGRGGATHCDLGRPGSVVSPATGVGARGGAAT
jgi:hypothetical protein